MALFTPRDMFLSIYLDCIKPPDHPPNLSKNLVLVNWSLSPGAIVFALH